MPVFQCPHCKKPISAPAKALGRKASCPICRRRFTIGDPPVAQAKAASRSNRHLSWMLACGGVVAGLLVAVVVNAWLREDPAPRPILWQPEHKIVAAESAKTTPRSVPTPDPAPKPEVHALPAKSTDGQLANLVAHLNEFRKAANLSAVTVDADLSLGCQAHADYVAANRDHPKLAGAAGLQNEDPALPGYTDGGKAAARASLLAFVEPNKALDLWFGRIVSRPPLLNPHLERIGIGAARSAGGAWATVLDPTRGHAVPTVAFPAPGQINVPLNFSGGPEVAASSAGFPISLQFPLGGELAAFEAVLTDQLGNRVPVWQSTPEQGLPGARRSGLIGMIPKQPLTPKSVYRVRVAGRINERPFEKSWEFTTEGDGDETGSRAAILLDRLNRIRRQADLAPVELDDDLSRGCRLHAKYLVVNSRRPEIQGMQAHQEDPKLPGYTAEGQKAGKAANIAIGACEPPDALDGWMATPYHRVPLLEPGLKKIGFDCLRGDRFEWVTVLDVGNGSDRTSRSRPVFWPVEGQVGVPVNFPPGGEIPNPIPEDKTGRAGYPVTAFFPTDSPLRNAKAKLEDPTGGAVACWFSSPESPANPIYSKHQGTMVCLIP
jgi:uncharacterized protein YkwD